MAPSTNEDEARRVAPLRGADVPAAIETLALAFDDDPVFRYSLPPEPEARFRWLQVVMGAMLAQSMPDGAVSCEAAADPTSPRVHGVIALGPPGTHPAPASRLLKFLFSRSRPAIPVPPLHTARTLFGFMRLIERHHLREPHWYVQCLGVHPTKQGTGIGKRLLTTALLRAERDGVPAYLETAKASNVSFYKRFGFEVTEEIFLHEGAPPLWTMTWRPRKTLISESS